MVPHHTVGGVSIAEIEARLPHIEAGEAFTDDSESHKNIRDQVRDAANESGSHSHRKEVNENLDKVDERVEEERERTKRVTIGLAKPTDATTEAARIYNWLNVDELVVLDTKPDWAAAEDEILESLGEDGCIYFILTTSHGGAISRHIHDSDGKFRAMLEKLSHYMCKNNKGLQLNSCSEAADQETRKRMAEIAKALGAKVKGWSDWYAVVPHGVAYTAYPDGTIEEGADTGRRWDGSWLQFISCRSDKTPKFKKDDGKPDKSAGKKGKGGKKDGWKTNEKGKVGLKDGTKGKKDGHKANKKDKFGGDGDKKTR